MMNFQHSSRIIGKNKRFTSRFLCPYMVIFRLFPTIPDASSVVTVFAGILASIAVIIQLHEHFDNAKQL
jgi:hypothetical protein